MGGSFVHWHRHIGQPAWLLVPLGGRWTLFAVLLFTLLLAGNHSRPSANRGILCLHCVTSLSGRKPHDIQSLSREDYTRNVEMICAHRPSCPRGDPKGLRRRGQVAGADSLAGWMICAPHEHVCGLTRVHSVTLRLSERRRALCRDPHPTRGWSVPEGSAGSGRGRTRTPGGFRPWTPARRASRCAGIVRRPGPERPETARQQARDQALSYALLSGTVGSGCRR